MWRSTAIDRGGAESVAVTRSSVLFGLGRRGVNIVLMPDVGVLSAHLLSGFQKKLFTRLAEAGHEHLRPRHGAVMAYIATSGTRASELNVFEEITRGY